MTRQKVLEAAKITRKLCEAFPIRLDDDQNSPCSLNHIQRMEMEMMVPGFPEDKLNRWLGWMQGVVVARGIASLERMKEINRGE